MPSADGWASVSVKEDLRDKLRVKKAKEGTDYDTILRQHLDLEALGMEGSNEEQCSEKHTGRTLTHSVQGTGAFGPD